MTGARSQRSIFMSTVHYTPAYVLLSRKYPATRSGPSISAEPSPSLDTVGRHGVSRRRGVSFANERPAHANRTATAITPFIVVRNADTQSPTQKVLAGKRQ